MMSRGPRLDAAVRRGDRQPAGRRSQRHPAAARAGGGQRRHQDRRQGEGDEGGRATAARTSSSSRPAAKSSTCRSTSPRCSTSRATPMQPVTYYPEPYPYYWNPAATFFAGAVTGAIWTAAVDWDDGFWGWRLEQQPRHRLRQQLGQRYRHRLQQVHHRQRLQRQAQRQQRRLAQGRPQQDQLRQEPVQQDRQHEHPQRASRTTHERQRNKLAAATSSAATTRATCSAPPRCPASGGIADQGHPQEHARGPQQEAHAGLQAHRQDGPPRQRRRQRQSAAISNKPGNGSGNIGDKPGKRGARPMTRWRKPNLDRPVGKPKPGAHGRQPAQDAFADGRGDARPRRQEAVEPRQQVDGRRRHQPSARRRRWRQQGQAAAAVAAARSSCRRAARRRRWRRRWPRTSALSSQAERTGS